MGRRDPFVTGSCLVLLANCLYDLFSRLFPPFPANCDYSEDGIYRTKKAKLAKVLEGRTLISGTSRHPLPSSSPLILSPHSPPPSPPLSLSSSLPLYLSTSSNPVLIHVTPSPYFILVSFSQDPLGWCHHAEADDKSRHL